MKLTLQEKLAKRKYKSPPTVFYWFYHLVMVDIKLKKHNPELEVVDDIKKEKNGAFLIWNHLSRLDHSYILKACYPKKFNMIAEYNEFFRSHLAIPFKLMSILPKKNFCVDSAGMKIMLSMAKKKKIMALAPEGLATVSGYNERIIAGVGKLLKHCKLPVYCMDFKGQGLAAPTFSSTYRLGGKTYCKLYKMFSVEDLAKLTDTEIEKTIQDAFCHDDYAWQEKNRFKWDTQGKGCEGIHDILYKCPKCNKEFTMVGTGDHIKCNNCGLDVYQNEYLEMIPNEIIDSFPSNYSKWVLWERKNVIDEIRKDANYSFSVNVKIGNLPKYKTVKGYDRSSVIVGEGLLTLDHSGIHYNGTRNGEKYTFDLSYQQYYRLNINIHTRAFALYIDNEYFEFFPQKRVVGKLDLITQEMNRLHFKSWEPLPEHRYLYKEYEK